MKAIILAGGFGERLKKIIKGIPKPMAPIDGKPFLEYLIMQLARQEINEIIISIGYKGEVIKEYFGNGKKRDVQITYSEEDEPLDTGGALKKAAELINDDYFIVMNGDSFLNTNFWEIISYCKTKKAIATIGLVYLNNTNRYGKVEINKRGEIIGFFEKKTCRNGFINSGIYIFNHRILNFIPNGKHSLESEVFPSLINKRLFGKEVNGFFIDIGIPQDYLKLSKNPGQMLTIFNK